MVTTLKAYHAFIELLARFIQTPPPRGNIGSYIESNPLLFGDEEVPKMFSINAYRDRLGFYARILVEGRSWLAGFVSYLALKEDGISVTIHHTPSDCTELENVPFSKLLEFHEITPSSASRFELQPEEPKPKTRQPEGDACVKDRHVPRAEFQRTQLP